MIDGFLYRLFFPIRRVIWGVCYLLVAIAWLLAWWPVWLFTGKNILEPVDPPFEWMKEAPK